jgi:hypothetical protein
MSTQLHACMQYVVISKTQPFIEPLHGDQLVNIKVNKLMKNHINILMKNHICLQALKLMKYAKRSDSFFRQCID